MEISKKIVSFLSCKRHVNLCANLCLSFSVLTLSLNIHAATPMSDDELEQSYLPIVNVKKTDKKPIKNCGGNQLNPAQNNGKAKNQTDSCNASSDKKSKKKNKSDEQKAENQTTTEDTLVTQESDEQINEKLFELTGNNISVNNGLSQLERDLVMSKAEKDIFGNKALDKEAANQVTKNPLLNAIGNVEINPDGTVSLTSKEPGVIEFDYIYRSINGDGINKGTDIEIPSVRAGYTEFKITSNK